MTTNTIVIGMLVSIVGGAILQWLLINRVAWPYLEKYQNDLKRGENLLTIPMGMIERGMITAAILFGVPQWIGIWLIFKVAVGWSAVQKRPSATVNLYLIGTMLSIIIGVLGAVIATGKWECF